MLISAMNLEVDERVANMDFIEEKIVLCDTDVNGLASVIGERPNNCHTLSLTLFSFSLSPLYLCIKFMFVFEYDDFIE